MKVEPVSGAPAVTAEPPPRLWSVDSVGLVELIPIPDSVLAEMATVTLPDIEPAQRGLDALPGSMPVDIIAPVLPEPDAAVPETPESASASPETKRPAPKRRRSAAQRRTAAAARRVNELDSLDGALLVRELAGRRLWVAGTTVTALVVVAAIAWRLGVNAALPAYLYFALLTVLIAWVDAVTHRIPDILTLPSYPIFGAFLLIGAVAGGGWGPLGRALAGALVCGLFFGVLALLGGGMGLGDVKLAPILGAALGWLGWATLVFGVLLGFLGAAVVAVLLLAARRRTWQAHIPFGPYLVAGALAAILATG